MAEPNRPPSISEEDWTTYLNVFNATPANRRTLDMPTNNEEARAAVRRMINAALDARAQTTRVDAEGRPEIFKATDPPAFTRLQDFPAYYSQLRFFMNGVEVSDNRCRQACFLILARWEGTQLAMYAQETDAGTLARNNWDATRQSILGWLDQKFRSKTDMADAIAKWNGTAARLQRKKFGSGIEFFLAFETELYEYRAACLRHAQQVPGQQEITNQFVNALPSAIAARTRETADDLDTSPYETYKSKISRIWTSHQQADIKINAVAAGVEESIQTGVKRAFAELEEIEPTVRVVKKRFIPRSTSNKVPCKNAWDKAPKELQGPIAPGSWMSNAEKMSARDRHKRVKNANVCARCRLPREKGHTLDSFQPVGPWDEAHVRMAEAAEDDEEEEEHQGREDPVD